MSLDQKAIRCYVSPRGNNRIADWYQSLSIHERADTDVFIKNMRRTEDWSMPHYRPKLRNYNMGELRWSSGKKAHRLIGFLKGGVFFALLGCTHKQNIYDPADALETAMRRKHHIDTGKASTVPYDE